MKTKRFLAWIICFAIAVTAMPVQGITALADALNGSAPIMYAPAPLASGTPTVTQSDTKENTNQAGGIIYTKTSTAKSDGTIDITLTAHTTGVVKQLNTVTPTDIVLVLDTSGSMNYEYDSFSVTTYTEALGRAYTYTTGFLLWTETHTGYGFNDSSRYYINTGTEAEPVYTQVSRTGRDANGYEYFEYSSGSNEIYVYPELQDGVAENRANSYTVHQFYSATTTTTNRSRMDVLKSAVDSFIDTTMTMNEGLDEAEMHTITVVKFADDSYFDGTRATSTLTTVTGNNRQNNGYNYSQVVKKLVPVDEDGAAELKAAVDSLQPGGATSVDFGVNLAEAVLMERSTVVAEGAVDRNEVVIVFTDGEPNHSSGFDEDVANAAIKVAGRMENSAGVTVYGVSVDANADETDISRNINKFMHYISSNFPSAEDMDTPGADGDMDAGYYMTPHGDMTLTMIFDAIIHEIDHPTISLGEEATMVDTVSPYFDFANGSATEVKLQTSARNADGTWADPVDDPHLAYEIVNDRLTVNGFDFDANYVSETGRGDSKNFYGKRLVVTFTVVPDYDVIDAASVTLMDGVLPTNSGFAALNDSDENAAAEVTTPELSTHQLTYKVDGKEYTTYQRFTGSDITVDAVPTKVGYVFSGWKYPSNITVTADEFTMPDEDVVITGTFTPAIYNVSYQYSGNQPDGAPELPKAHTAAYNSTVTVADPLKLEGYVFKGWTPLQTDVKPTDGKFTMPAKDVVLVGYFESSTSTPYTIEHYLETLTDGVYETDPVLVEDGLTGTTGATVSATPLNRFTGFKYNETKSAATISGTIKADGSLVLKVYYDRLEYKVTYGYEGDTDIDDLPALPTGGTFKYGQTVTVADKAVPPAGYTFTGWYRGTTDNPVDGTFEMPAFDVQLLGYFTANSGTKYQVEHYLMETDGTYADKPAVTEDFTGTTGDVVKAIPLPTFDGFTYNEVASAATAGGIVEGDGSLVLKLFYDRNQYKVTYEYERTVPDGAPAVPGTESYYHGETVEIADEPEVPGYTFSGWHIHDENVTVTNDEFEMPMRDVTAYGYFTANTDTPYTVEHYVEKLDGSGYEDDPHTTQNLKGTTGAEVTAASIAIAGFTYNAGVSTASGVIAGDGSLVLKLYYDRNDYKVTYEYEGTVPAGASALPAQSTHAYGEKVTVADKATAPAGYTFVGWYSGEVTNIVTEITMPARDVVLIGYFKPNSGTEYQVEHYLMETDGEYADEPAVTADFTGTTGETVTAAPLPTFDGFTYNSAKSASTASGTVVGDGSLVLKLYYDRNQYKVTYEYERTVPDGAPAVPGTESYYHGETVEIADEPEVPGYTFSGWHIHVETVTVTNGEFEMPMRDVNVYGYFTANTDTPYTVEHYVEKLDGSGYEDDPHTTQNLKGTTGAEVTAASIAIAGFTYNAGVSTASGVIAGDGSLVLKLYYDRNEYKVTYEYEGTVPTGASALPAQSTHAYGEKVTVADKATAPAGYTFVGWYSGEVTNIVTEITMPARDVVLRGYFKPGENVPYAVHHYMETLTDGVYETEPALVEDGFTGTTGRTVTATPLNRFTGFKYNEAKSAATIKGVIAGDGSLILKVYYDREQYKVTYGYEGEIPTSAPALPAGGTYVYGADVTVAADATAPAGYTFVGWYRGTEDRHVEGTFAMPAYDVNLLGNFSVNTNTPYRVEHYLQNEEGDGYTLDGAGETRHGVTGATASALPREYPGFTYNKGISTESGTIKGNGSLTLKFYYDRNTNDVTYIYEGIVPEGAPDAPDAQNGVRYGVTVTVEDTPEVPGYTFNGWTTADAEIEDGKFIMPDKDVVLKGSFFSKLVDYKVNYWFQKVDAGDTFKKADYVLEDSYTRQAYTGQHVEADAKNHAGFSVNTAHSNSYGHVTVDKNGNGTLILNIYYDRHSYDVTYGYYGEQPAGAPDVSGYNRTKVRYGTVLNVEAKPSLDGYAFDGWYTHTAAVDNGKFTMPDHNVEFLGRFVQQFRVSYDLNGGTAAKDVDYSTKVVDAGTVITVNAAPTRDGYIFDGWKENGKFHSAGEKVTVERNMTFVAQWTPEVTIVPDFTLTYETNGGDHIPQEIYAAGTVVELTKVPVRDGYIFRGWHIDEKLTKDVDEVTMTNDITVYADWEKDTTHETPDDLNGEDHFAYIMGYPDGTVRPNAYVTRAEVTAIFFRLLKPEVRDANLSDSNIFEDVNEGNWYNTPVSTMMALGIIQGRTPTEYMPDAYITRAEFASVCARFDDSSYEIVDNFTDIGTHWAADEIHEAAAHGWIKGYEDGTFRPDRLITRAEAMTMINRVLNRVPETPDDLMDGMITWPDNDDEDEWYYLAVQEATNSHDYRMKNSHYEEWIALRDNTDWTKYED